MVKSRSLSKFLQVRSFLYRSMSITSALLLSPEPRRSLTGERTSRSAESFSSGRSGRPLHGPDPLPRRSSDFSGKRGSAHHSPRRLMLCGNTYGSPRNIQWGGHRATILTILHTSSGFRLSGVAVGRQDESVFAADRTLWEGAELVRGGRSGDAELSWRNGDTRVK